MKKAAVTNNPVRAKLWMLEGKKVIQFNNIYIVKG